MDLFKLEEKLNKLLLKDNFLDDSINGIQVEGKRKVKKVATGVSASVALFNEAKKWGADAIVVHHGILWRGMDIKVQSSFKERLKILLQNEVSLLAYHLPLDAHPEIGNNTQIGKKLGLKKGVPFGEYKGNLIGFSYTCNFSAEKILQKIKELFGEPINHIPCSKKRIRKLAIVSGGAQKEFLQVSGKDIDLFLTGEISEFVVELAKEINCHFVSAGHYRTEKFGIMALTEKIKEMGMESKFFDIPHIY
ncbi:MAG: Nif3-like dinuclear metal center hexameric protein [Thermoanaerobaculia bacterium]